MRYFSWWTACRLRPARLARGRHWSFRPGLHPLEDRWVPAGQTFVIADSAGLISAVNQSNLDAANGLTSSADPDVIQWAVAPVNFNGVPAHTGFLRIDGDLTLAGPSAFFENFGQLRVVGDAGVGGG